MLNIEEKSVAFRERFYAADLDLHKFILIGIGEERRVYIPRLPY